MKNVKGFILDWAGTSVDYGSIAPTQAFINAFAEFDIILNTDTVRKFMGLHKKVHTQSIINEQNITSQWLEKFNRMPNDTDVDKIFKTLGPAMEKAVSDFSDPIPGVIDFMNYYKRMGLKFGSTTGYVREMMNILNPIVTEKGLIFDSIVTPDEVPEGRPYPWMVYKNAMNMGVFPMWQMVKIGDTLADIEEGLNAGMWIIGITKSGNEMGLSQKEVGLLSDKDLKIKIKKIEDKFFDAGAHYVAESVHDCYQIIDEIDNRIQMNEKPY